MNLNNSSPLNNNEFIGQFVKTIHEPVIVCDNHLNITYFNNHFSLLLKEIELGKNINELLNINPSSTAITQNHYSESLNSLVKLSPILLQNNLEGFIITLEKKDTVADNSSSKPAIRAAAHDLNNILTNILNSIDLLKQPDDYGLAKDKLLKIIENNSNRAADIVESILKKDSKKAKSYSKTNINSLLEEIATSFKLFLPDRISFITNIQYGLPNVMGNHTELYRSIYNLLINAKEAISDKGEISLTANQLLPLSEDGRSRQKYISIRIQDSGIGFNKEVKNKLFENGFSTKDKKHISGIGLNNVKEIIENHEGNIVVSSDLGKGSTFELQLPVIEQKKGPIIEDVKKILIAEDEDTLRELLKDLFESYGFTVTAVGDGLELMRELNNDPFHDLLIIDKKMPDMDGLECIKEIRKNNNRIPIILATGSTAEDLKVLEKTYNIQKAIKKPYKFDDLLRLVNKSVSSF